MFEPRIGFAPSYPFVEDLVNASKYSETRCPSWCDRVLLSKDLWHRLFSNGDAEENKSASTSFVEYDMIGETSAMGDHKVRRRKRTRAKAY